MRVDRVAAIAVSIAVSGAGSAAQAPLNGPSCQIEYVIGPEDVLDVAVWGNADMTRTVPVRPDGKISLPLINDVQAAGMTPMELREALTTALKTYISEAAVSVIVREVHSFKVTVIGQVKNAGRYEVKDRPTVLDVLALAGGLNEFAARSRIAVLRQDNGKPQQIPFPYDRLSSGQRGQSAAQENFCVKPGDIVFVP